VVGIDRGVTATLATSDGRLFRAPVMRKRERARLARLQQRLARHRKGSGRRRATKRRIAALQQLVADRRRDWIEVRTTRLVRDYDLVAVEDLAVRNMVRRPDAKPDPDQPGVCLANGAAAKTGLNRSIHQQAWSLWLRRLTDKAQASGVLVEHVNPRDTSRECRACGHVAAENRESQAVFPLRRLRARSERGHHRRKEHPRPSPPRARAHPRTGGKHP
jgi:putative transposase